MSTSFPTGFPYSVDVELQDGRAVWYEGVMLAESREQAIARCEAAAADHAAERGHRVIRVNVNTAGVTVIGVS
jgi:hypothetical protein